MYKMNAQELIEKKVNRRLSRKIPQNFEIDEEKKNIIVSKVLNSYIKYQNKKVNAYHKEHVEIYDMVDYNEKIVLFD